MEHGLLRRYFAAFSKIPGFSNWVIAKASLELKKPEIKNGHSQRGNGYSEGKGGHSNINVNIGKAGRGYEGL